ncbi:UPF0316 protein DP2912 [Striga asiatica]|uniref:UPF0316 protein DP2912 n=1 Tax=Striga asiatica TaxID=4170 RepID=A0A5A7PGI4_STRAF|nr:UPF0316 protein DP2912 [Striga asiatica]
MASSGPSEFRPATRDPPTPANSSPQAASRDLEPRIPSARATLGRETVLTPAGDRAFDSRQPQPCPATRFKRALFFPATAHEPRPPTATTAFDLCAEPRAAISVHQPCSTTTDESQPQHRDTELRLSTGLDIRWAATSVSLDLRPSQNTELRPPAHRRAFSAPPSTNLKCVPPHTQRRAFHGNQLSRDGRTPGNLGRFDLFGWQLEIELLLVTDCWWRFDELGRSRIRRPTFPDEAEPTRTRGRLCKRHRARASAPDGNLLPSVGCAKNCSGNVEGNQQ